jgi:hypothetical protein
LTSAKSGSAGLASAGVLDLDDLGAEPSERLSAGWARFELRQIEHSHPGKTIEGRGVFIHRYLILQSRR